MIIRLKGATFTTNIGTLDSWSIKYTTTNGSVTKKSGATSIKKDDADGEILVFEFDTAKYTYKSGTIMSNDVSAGTISVSGNTITVNVNAGTTLGGKVEINFVMEAIGGGEPEEPDTPVNPPADNPTTPNTVTWELGAINSGGGPNSTDMPTKRIRTAGYLQVESSITIRATGNVEFCPVYYRADKTYISSPNKYQTTDCVVSASEYPLVRLMIRDKTSTSADLTSKLTELGNSIVITGNFVEIPYDETSGGGTSGTTGATGIGEGATWQSGAIDSNSGNGSVVMASRIHTGFIPLGNVTVSVSGDAEFCPFLYNADKTYIKPSTTPTYQKTTQTWTSADGAYLVLMARNSSATSATIDPSYGANVNIQIN